MPSGAIRFHVTGTAPPAGIVTVNGGPLATAGSSFIFAVTVISFSVLLRKVKVAPKLSPVRTNGGMPENIVRSCAVRIFASPVPKYFAPSVAIATSRNDDCASDSGTATFALPLASSGTRPCHSNTGRKSLRVTVFKSPPPPPPVLTAFRP